MTVGWASVRPNGQASSWRLLGGFRMGDHAGALLEESTSRTGISRGPWPGSSGCALGRGLGFTLLVAWPPLPPGPSWLTLLGGALAAWFGYRLRVPSPTAEDTVLSLSGCQRPPVRWEFQLQDCSPRGHPEPGVQGRAGRRAHVCSVPAALCPWDSKDSVWSHSFNSGATVIAPDEGLGWPLFMPLLVTLWVSLPLVSLLLLLVWVLLLLLVIFLAPVVMVSGGGGGGGGAGGSGGGVTVLIGGR